jgi:hypothetical protein
MKRLVRTTTGIAGTLFAFVALAMAYSTAKGYTVWFIKIPHAVITVNGRQTTGWLHEAHNGNTIFFTRSDSSKPETYDLVFANEGNGQVLSCGAWVASRLPLIAIGDVNPPCFFEGSAGRGLTKGPRSIAFTTNEGARVEARW